MFAAAVPKSINTRAPHRPAPPPARPHPPATAYSVLCCGVLCLLTRSTVRCSAPPAALQALLEDIAGDDAELKAREALAAAHGKGQQ